MSTKYKPDHEMAVMQRGLRELAALSPPGRRRVLAYWCARVDSLPTLAADSGGIEDEHDEELPVMPHLQGAAAE